jgi:hypothetical protein
MLGWECGKPLGSECLEYKEGNQIILRQILGKWIRGWEVDVTGSGSRSLVGSGINGVLQVLLPQC